MSHTSFFKRPTVSSQLLDPVPFVDRIAPPSREEPLAGRPATVSSTKENLFHARPPRASLNQLVLPDWTRKQFSAVLSRIRNRKLLYEDWNLSTIDSSGRHTAVNFYGPPGTGKTLCCEALAAELKRPIIDVNYADVESRYVGETPKNIVAAFQKATEENAVLFFDEADSILGRRMTDVTQAADQAVNVSRAVMLKQLDSFNGVVVFATNLARNFDVAFVRRILFHVEVLPPDRQGRSELWQKMISPAVPGRDELDWELLAEHSAGLSGGEIKNAVVLCLSELADRDPRFRRLNSQDVLAVIEQVLNAKHSVGARQGSHLHEEFRTISRDSEP